MRPLVMSVDALPFVTALVGSGVGLSGALYVSHRERGAQHRAEIRRTLSAFTGSISQAVSLFEEMPPSSGPDWFDRGLATMIGSERAYVRNQMAVQHAFGTFPRDVGLVIAQARNHLVMLGVPPELLALVDEAMGYTRSLTTDRRPENVEKWRDLHERLTAAGQAL